MNGDQEALERGCFTVGLDETALASRIVATGRDIAPEVRLLGAPGRERSRWAGPPITGLSVEGVSRPGLRLVALSRACARAFVPPTGRMIGCVIAAAGNAWSSGC
jgi:hypothetical protein